MIQPAANHAVVVAVSLAVLVGPAAARATGTPAPTGCTPPAGGAAPTLEEAIDLEPTAADPSLGSALHLYGQFVGDWTVQVTNYPPDAPRQDWSGEWRFGWILEGRAVQDVWRVPTREESARTGTSVKGFGTTVRTYDPKTGAWTVVFFGAVTGTVVQLTAHQKGDEIVQEGKDPVTGLPVRWIFHDIRPHSFRWRAVISRDGGATWDVEQEMTAQRKSRSGQAPGTAP